MRTVHFKTNILIKDIIGKGLINDDNLAVIELIKNSFDAKSTTVEIEFKYLTNKTISNIFDTNKQKISTLIIKDNGSGMDADDIENKWLNIAYSEKKNKSDITTHVFAGDKGVGRFSCDRLGKKLNLFTQKANCPIFHLEINWEDFENGDIDTTIQSIDIGIKTISPEDLLKRGFKIDTHGTILEMTQLRSNWSKPRIKNLKTQYLSKLLNPNQQYVKNNITLNLTILDYPEYSGEIKNLVFQKLEFRTTSIEAFTRYENETDKLIINTKLRHKGQEIIEIEEVNNKFKDLKDVRIVVYYLNSYAKVRFFKESGERTKDYGSIFLFLNGFRVSPYGEAENDWLGLELRKGQGQQRFFSARDIIGRIEVTDFNGVFRPVSSREGLINNNAFNLLVDKDAISEGYDDNDEKKEYGLFYQTITALEKYVVNGLKWDSAVTKNYADEFEDALIKNSKSINELYAESEAEKDKRCLEALQSILRTRKGEIIRININNDLVLQLLENDEEKSKKILKSFERYSDIIDIKTIGTLDKIKMIFKEKEDEIERQKAKLSIEEQRRLSAEEQIKTEEKKRLLAEEKAQKAEEKSRDEELRRKEAELREREAKILAEESRLRADQERIAKEKAEEEMRQKEYELEIEKKKNKYLLSKKINIDDDTAGLIHHISLLNDIPELVNVLIRIIRTSEINKSDILDELIKIKKKAEKVLAVSKLITSAGFNKQIDKQRIDIPRYIQEYIENYYEFNEKKSLNLSVINNFGSFFKQISPLDLSIILDNFIENAKKWKAQNMLFQIEKSDNNNIKINISDDGQGFSQNLMKNPNQVFQLGISQSDGSGIGLYYVSSLLNEMNATVAFSGNNTLLKGANFTILFN